MDIQEFESLAFQEYIDHENGARYVLDFIEGNDEDGQNFFTIKQLDEDGEEDFLGTTPDNGNNVAMMAWEYNAVPVREV
ncbi:hypothetical protein EFT43_07735 [Leuconostoc falkenbergense]|uniref:hypothetical protein n=1 Tax=Leuconostoc falkenbergense TaxID=2766470 RepID=UPI0021AAACEC|nr:hypothetical protein [Leuconostoc falkenbergense]MCT4404787.1 hypothetical protein [Leuconostoc falkenbergense]